jgi:hypothetical protein
MIGRTKKEQALKMSKQHKSIVTFKLLSDECRTDFEEGVGFSMTRERAEELLDILHNAFLTANHKESFLLAGSIKELIADNKAFREFQARQRAKGPEMSVATSMAFGEEIDELRTALCEEKRQNAKLVGIVESCVLTGKIVQEKGEVLAAENLQLKKDLFTWKNIGRTGLDDCDKFYKEVLGLRDEVAQAKALAADWEKKCNEAVLDQDESCEADSAEIKELKAELLAVKEACAKQLEALNLKHEELKLRRKIERPREAALAYDDGYATAEEKWTPMYKTVCEQLELVRKEKDVHQSAYVRVFKERDELIVANMDLKKQLVSKEAMPEPSPFVLGTPAVPAEVPVEVPVEESSMRESEKMAEEADTILQLVNALRQREESITQLIDGPAKKCLNPEDEE